MAAMTRAGNSLLRAAGAIVFVAVVLLSAYVLAPATALAAEPQVGTSETFYAYDWASGQRVQLQAVCRYVGEHVVIYGDQAAWLSQYLVDQLGGAFDDTIYPTLTGAYGAAPEPGIDGDPRTYILIYDFNDSTNGVEGLFDPCDLDPQGSATSNRREMFYLNREAILAEPYNIAALAAHEFAHLIVYYRDTLLDPSPRATPEALWLTEGFATYAEHLCGYDGRVNAQLQSFCNQPDHSLTHWEGVRADYGASYAFLSYLAQREGPAFIRALVEQPLDGIAGIDATLSALWSASTFDSLFGEWVLALFLDSRRPELPPYSFPSLTVSPAVTAVAGAQPWLSAATVSNFGAVFLDFPAGSTAAAFQVVLDGAPGAPLQAALVSWDSLGLLAPSITSLDLDNPAGGDTVESPPGYDRHTLVVWACGPEGASGYYGFTCSGAYDPPGGLQFLDLGGSDHYYPYVAVLLERGVVGGKEIPEGSGLRFFAGQENVLRAQFAKMIMEATGLHTPEIDNLGAPTFTDVRPVYKDGVCQAYPYDYVEEAAALGIVNGYHGGYFGPYDPITRAQLVLMIIRGAAAAGRPLPAHTGSEKVFADVPLSHPYYQEIMTAYQAGIMSGSVGSDGRLYFRPYSPATRNHVAKMTANLIGLLEEAVD